MRWQKDHFTQREKINIVFGLSEKRKAQLKVQLLVALKWNEGHFLKLHPYIWALYLVCGILSIQITLNFVWPFQLGSRRIGQDVCK